MAIIRTDELWLKEQIRLEAIKLPITEASADDWEHLVLEATKKRIIKHQLLLLETDYQHSARQNSRRSSFMTRGLHFDLARSNLEATKSRLESAADRLVKEVFDEIRASNFANKSAYWDAKITKNWRHLTHQPQAPSAEMSPRAAELFVAQLLLYMGATGSKVTTFTKDGGVDVETNALVVQVKHLSKPVGVATLREILGVGVSLSKLPAVFSKSGFSKEARAFAHENNVLIFEYLPLLDGLTSKSRDMLRTGLGSL